MVRLILNADIRTRLSDGQGFHADSRRFICVNPRYLPAGKAGISVNPR